MKFRILFFCLLMLGLCAGSADAARRTALKDVQATIEPAGITTAITQAMVRSAIVDACARYGWNVRPISDRELQASIVVRGKHHVTVKIVYDTKAFSISYVSSENMNYREDAEEGVQIHPNYNKWIRNIEQEAKVNLARLQAK